MVGKWKRGTEIVDYICYIYGRNTHNITVLFTATSYVVLADNHNSLLPLPILYSFCPKQASLLVIALCLVE